MNQDIKWRKDFRVDSPVLRYGHSILPPLQDQEYVRLAYAVFESLSASGIFAEAGGCALPPAYLLETGLPSCCSATYSGAP